MSSIDTEAFRRRLIERRDQLHVDHGANMRQVGSSADHTTPDAVDLASETAEFDVAVCAAHIEGEELDAIDGALQRIERGEFGICAECDETINPKRLEALPYARFCIDCQRAHESGRSLVLDDV